MMRILIVAVLALTLSACASAPVAPADEFDRYAAKVEIEMRAAEKDGFLWRDTERLMEEARQAKKAGRFDEAMALAGKAMRQAQLAQQQIKDNADAGPVYSSVP